MKKIIAVAAAAVLTMGLVACAEEAAEEVDVDVAVEEAAPVEAAPVEAAPVEGAMDDAAAVEVDVAVEEAPAAE